MSWGAPRFPSGTRRRRSRPRPWRSSTPAPLSGRLTTGTPSRGGQRGRASGRSAASVQLAPGLLAVCGHEPEVGARELPARREVLEFEVRELRRVLVVVEDGLHKPREVLLLEPPIGARVGLQREGDARGRPGPLGAENRHVAALLV